MSVKKSGPGSIHGILTLFEKHGMTKVIDDIELENLCHQLSEIEATKNVETNKYYPLFIQGRMTMDSTTRMAVLHDKGVIITCVYKV